MKRASRKTRRVLPALMAAGLGLGALNGCSYLPFSSSPEFVTLSGQADSEERVTLPASAEFDVALIDASNGRETLATLNQPNPGQFPLRFTLRYDRSGLDPEHDYVLDASVRIDGQLSYINVEPVPVLTDGASDGAIAIELERVN